MLEEETSFYNKCRRHINNGSYKKTYFKIMYGFLPSCTVRKTKSSIFVMTVVFCLHDSTTKNQILLLCWGHFFGDN